MLPLAPDDALIARVAGTIANVPFPVAKSLEEAAAFTMNDVFPAGVAPVVVMVSVVVMELAPLPK